MDGKPSMSLPMALIQLLLAIAQVLARTIFQVSSSRTALSYSSIFLITFIVVHALGNMTCLVSGDFFNQYGHHLHSLGWLLTAVEVYLFSGFTVHALTGIWITYKDKKVKLSGFSWQTAKLALSGSVILTFVIVHVFQFRFGTWYKTTVHGVEMRDLWRLQKEVFAKPSNVLFYEVAVLTLCSHLFWGWKKVVNKPAGLGKFLPREAHKFSFLIGDVMNVLVTICFVTVPLYVHFRGMILNESQIGLLMILGGPMLLLIALETRDRLSTL